jgi:aspartate aminotransferase
MSKTPTGLYSRPQAPESAKHLGTDPIPLNTGAPPFPVHPSVSKAIIKAVEASKEKLSYPPTRGLEDLRKKVAHDYGYADEGVLITYGASQALYNILDTIGDEEVLIPAPFWFAFPNIVAQGRGKLKIIQTNAENNFKLTPQQLAQSITWKSRILLLTNPNNPTGAIYTRDELDALVEVLKKHPRLLVVSDEVYNLLSLDGKPCPSISSWPEMHERVLVINSLSKNFAMSGLRVGSSRRIRCGPTSISRNRTTQPRESMNSCNAERWPRSKALTRLSRRWSRHCERGGQRLSSC